ncbi:hypothetical protein CEB3_c17490 [Peptococcaceae bacterium CEB3]|nr:hypothetical protein CEB3_c17490 [Peptococcaceae bacterium CEB3]
MGGGIVVDRKIDRTIREYEAKIGKEIHPRMKKLYEINLGLLKMLRRAYGPQRGPRNEKRTGR